MIADIDHLTFELSLMKSLEVLLIESIQVHQLETRHTLPDQLVKLEVRRSLKLLQVSLVIEWGGLLSNYFLKCLFD